MACDKARICPQYDRMKLGVARPIEGCCEQGLRETGAAPLMREIDFLEFRLARLMRWRNGDGARNTVGLCVLDHP